MSINAIINLALAFMSAANIVLGWVEKAKLREEVRSQLIVEQSLLLIRATGRAREAKGEVEKWSEEQLDDYLSQP